MKLTPEAELLRLTLGGKIRSLSEPVVSLEDLQGFAAAIAPVVAPGLTQHEIEHVLDQLMDQYDVVMGEGYGVVDKATFTPWLNERKANTELPRSEAYQELLLQRGWAGQVIETLDRQTDRIMDLVGDPEKSGAWSRRGIAIGEVQSGKTATYISLLAKAIDYGFKIIIVIGGHTEDLRRQTQRRLDSDLTGIDSAYLADHISHNDLAQIGVGKINKHLPDSIHVLTTTQDDFSSRSKRAGRVALGAGAPTLFVVKKNHKVLTNLAEYLKAHIPGNGDQLPLLLIDDEADWASINTSSEDEVTAVNAAIRKLLDCSNRNSYVGITATPFANIFINDEAEKDLFPRDFIQVLESPSNYQGVREYFTTDTHPALVEDVDDLLRVLPYSHKASARLKELPASLKRAIAAFFVGTALRRFRDGEARPASMLINVSRFKAVQARIFELAEQYISELSAAILSEFGMPDGSPQGVNSRFLEETYMAIYADADVPWMYVREQLIAVADEIRARLINGDTKAARDKWIVQTPRSVREADALVPTVFVGGDVLARGLTLDGLQVSYYARRASAADTLLQMGRWFGYRPAYEDLVRLWIDPETSELFRWTADLSQQLRDSIAEMNAKGLTPKDFGLKMQRHPEGFQIANAKKMQHAEDYVGVISLNSSVWESHMLTPSRDDRDRNRGAVIELIGRLGPADESVRNGSIIWRGVSSDLVLEFFRAFRAHPANHPFGSEPGHVSALVAGFGDIKNGDAWDIAMIAGSGRELQVSGLPAIHTSVRDGVGLDGDIVRFPNRRVASGADLASLVPGEAKARLKAANGDKDLADRELARRALVRPTLMLYMVTATDGDETGGGGYRKVVASPSQPLPAVVVATPQLTQEEELEEIRANRGARWKINRVLARQLMGWPDDADDEIEDGDL